MNSRFLLPVLLMLAAPSVAAAQDIDLRIDEAKAEVKADKATRKDDRKDIKAIQKLRKKWEKARSKGKTELEASVDADLAAWVKEEIGERRHDVRDAREEYVDAGGTPSGGESGGVTKGKPSAGSGDRRKPSADDRSSHPPRAEDDGEDLEREEGSLERLKEIAAELREIQPKFDSGSARGPAEDKKRKLLASLEEVATRDLTRTERELAEDEAELDRLKAKKKAR